MQPSTMQLPYMFRFSNEFIYNYVGENAWHYVVRVQQNNKTIVVIVIIAMIP